MMITKGCIVNMRSTAVRIYPEINCYRLGERNYSISPVQTLISLKQLWTVSDFSLHN